MAKRRTHEGLVFRLGACWASAGKEKAIPTGFYKTKEVNEFGNRQATVWRVTGALAQALSKGSAEGAHPEHRQKETPFHVE
jgi:hypothetical protein